MGETPPLPLASQPTVALPPSQAAADVQKIAAMLLDVPDIYADLSRPVQISGTLLDMLASGQMTFRTLAGQVRVTLENLPAQTLQNLFETLRPLAGTMQTIDLCLLPGSPPTQLTLLLPKTPPALAQNVVMPESKGLPASLSAAPQAISFIQGQSLKVSLLPGAAESLFQNETFIASGAGQGTTLFPKPSEGGLRTFPEISFIKASIDQSLQALALVARQTALTSKNALQPLPKAEIGLGDASAAKLSTPLPSVRSLPMGFEGNLTLDQILPPQADWPADLAPHQIKLTVSGQSPTGHILLKSEGKSFFVHGSGTLPDGSKIVATLIPHAKEQGAPIPLLPETDFYNLRELVASLREIDPAAAQQFVQAKIPNPAHHLAGTLMFFLSALHAGNIEGWLGTQNAAKLERWSKGAALDKVKQDLAESSGAAHDSRVGDWKSWAVPVQYGSSLEMLKLYVHDEAPRRQDNDGASETAKRTRFVISMNMSRLGALQLDGLSQLRQLDLIIRSEHPLPAALPAALRETYMDTIDALGLKGSILFQSGRQNWVIIEDQTTKAVGLTT